MSREIPPMPGSLGPPPEPASAWAPAAGGLHTYALGLTWRLILTVIGYLVLLFALQSRSASLVTFIRVAMPLIGIATGLVMLTGLIRFTRHPTDSQARSSAVFAAAVFGVAFVLELIGLVLVLDVLGAKPATWADAESIHESARLASKVGVWAVALGFAHLLAILVAFRSLARRVGQKQLGGQAASVGVLVLFSAALVVSIKWWLPHAQLDMGIAMTLAITTLGVAIAAVAVYIRLVSVMADTLLAAREHGLPTSELLR